MNKIAMMLITLLVCGVFGMVQAAQDTTLDQKQVRDPRYLETWLETNASDAESRIAAVEASGVTGSNTLVTVGALYVTGAVTIAEGKLADSTVVSADIKNGEIVDADVNASAAIAVTKLGTGATIPANSAASLTNLTPANISNGNIASGVKQTYSVLSVSVANSATLTPVPETMYVLTPTGMALGGTVTITLNPLAPANAGTGTVFWICNSDAATGLVAIAKTGTFYSDALSINTGCVATVYNFGVTNKFYGK